MSKEVCRLKNGRFVKKKNYLRYENRVKKKLTSTIVEPITDSSVNKKKFEVHGRRIIDLKMLVNKNCIKCKSKLHFANAVGESRVGVHSTFSIKCENCHNINKVQTGDKNDKTFANNTTMVMGKKIIILIIEVF